MVQANTAAARIPAVGHEQPHAVRLFKRDHPRYIDQYIDYFGNEDLRDPCGETVLDACESDADGR